MKKKAMIVFSIVGLVTAAALIIPPFIPCNADNAQCLREKIIEKEAADCQLKTFECR